jgi:hypothetical protein
MLGVHATVTDQIRRVRRKIAKSRKVSEVWNAERIIENRRFVDELNQSKREVNECMAKLAGILHFMDPSVNELFEREEVLDLLNVNQCHRELLEPTECGFLNLIDRYGMEDSADRVTWGYSRPMHFAMTRRKYFHIVNKDYWPDRGDEHMPGLKATVADILARFRAAAALLADGKQREIAIAERGRRLSQKVDSSGVREAMETVRSEFHECVKERVANMDALYLVAGEVAMLAPAIDDCASLAQKLELLGSDPSNPNGYPRGTTFMELIGSRAEPIGADHPESLLELLVYANDPDFREVYEAAKGALVKFEEIAAMDAAEAAAPFVHECAATLQ